MKIYIKGGTGKLVQGHVLDCNKKHLETALKQYDKQLYLRWNPYKTILTNGKTRIVPPEGEYWTGWAHGCWELRRKPNQKIAVPKFQLGKSIVFELEYVETDVENHIKDVQYLNYSLLQWVKDNDCWKTKNWVDDLEYREDQSYNKKLDHDQSELKYRIHHERRAMRDFQEQIKSGVNPLQILGGDWSGSSRS